MDEKVLDEERDRRRSPRFSRGGRVRIACLPSNGIPLTGTIRNLSLGGCSIQTPSRLEAGTRVDVLVHVNTSSFRAIGVVTATRGAAGIGMEFVRLSAGGQEILGDLVEELARQQALAAVSNSIYRRAGFKSQAVLNGPALTSGNGAHPDSDDAHPQLVDPSALTLNASLDLLA